MFKKTFIVSYVFFFSLMALASTSERTAFDDNSDLELPFKLEETQGGFPESPVIPCPRPNADYSALLNSLREIQTKIKEDSCPKGQAELATENLNVLLGDERKKFLELVKEGYGSGNQLSAKQTEEINQKVEAFVNKAAQISGVAKNRNCFSKEDGNSTLAFVSSVITEISGAVGALAGPFGAKIKLGGDIASGLLKSVDQVVTAQQGYDFSDIDQLDSYFSNLCAYHDFKSDIDIENDFTTRRRRLSRIYRQANKYIDEVQKICESCADIVAQFEEGERNREAIDLVNPRRVEVPDGERDKNQVNFEELANQTNSIVSEEEYKQSLDLNPLASTSFNELINFFVQTNQESVDGDKARYAAIQKNIEEQTKQNAESERSLTPSVAIPPGFVEESGSGWRLIPPRPIVYMKGFSVDGFDRDPYELPVVLTEGPKVNVPFLDPVKATIRALLIRAWSKDQVAITELKLHRSKGVDARDFVAEMQDQIEDVLIAKEAKNYVKQIIKNLNRSIKAIVSDSEFYLNKFELGELVSAFQPIEGKYEPKYLQTGSDTDARIAGAAFHHLFKHEIEFSHILDIIEPDARIPYKRGEFEFTQMERNREMDKFNKNFTDLISRYEVVQEKCIFFTHSYFRNHEVVEKQCKRAGEAMVEAKKIFEALKETSYVVLGGFNFKRIEAPRPLYVMDFIASVKNAIDRDLNYLLNEVKLVDDAERTGRISFEQEVVVDEELESTDERPDSVIIQNGENTVVVPLEEVEDVIDGDSEEIRVPLTHQGE